MITDKVKKAMQFALKKHRGQTHGEYHYAIHCFEVMFILIEHGIWDEDTLCTAALHDVSEDCGIPFDELTKKFGLTVAIDVASLTDDPRLPRAQQLLEQIETMDKKTIGAIATKFADRISNLRRAKGRRPPSGRRLDHSTELLQRGEKRLASLNVHADHNVWKLAQSLSEIIRHHAGEGVW